MEILRSGPTTHWLQKGLPLSPKDTLWSELPVACSFEMAGFRGPYSSSTMALCILEIWIPWKSSKKFRCVEFHLRVWRWKTKVSHLYIKVGGEWMLNPETTAFGSISHLALDHKFTMGFQDNNHLNSIDWVYWEDLNQKPELFPLPLNMELSELSA